MKFIECLLMCNISKITFPKIPKLIQDVAPSGANIAFLCTFLHMIAIIFKKMPLTSIFADVNLPY